MAARLSTSGSVATCGSEPFHEAVELRRLPSGQLPWVMSIGPRRRRIFEPCWSFMSTTELSQMATHLAGITSASQLTDSSQIR